MAGIVLVEVHMAPGKHVFELSKELVEETGAQVMTAAEAKGVGFDGLPAPPDGRDVRYVAVRDRDSRWILNALEADPNVSGFKMHQIDD